MFPKSSKSSNEVIFLIQKSRFNLLCKKAIKNAKRFPALENNIKDFEKLNELKPREWQRTKVINRQIIYRREDEDNKYFKIKMLIGDDYHKITRLLMNDFNEKLWNTTLKEIQTLEFREDECYSFDASYLIKNKEEKYLLCEQYMRYTWNRGEKIYFAKLEKSGKSSFEGISHFPISGLKECLVFERATSSRSKKEKTIVTAYAIVPKTNTKLDSLISSMIETKFDNFSSLSICSAAIYAEALKKTEKEPEYHVNSTVEELFTSHKKEENERMKKLQNSKPDRKINLNETELDKFYLLKDKIADRFGEEYTTLVSDNIFCRFLCGNGWEVVKAEDKLKQFLNWTKVKKFFHVSTDNFPSYKKIGFCSVMCKDRVGRPVLYFCFRKIIPPEIDAQTFAVFHGRFVHETLQNLAPQTIDNYILIYETKGISYTKNVDLKLFGTLAPVLGTFFPETSFRIYLINAGMMMRGVYKAAKQFIHQRTVNKIQVVGGGAELTQALLNDITIEQLPVFLGGKNASFVEPS